MAQFACRDANSSQITGEDDDWGSDFEGELYRREIEDNKINEIREANLLRNSLNDVQILTEDNSPTDQIITGNHSVNASKTGAIPKSGFSYLSNISNTDSNKVFVTTGKESGNTNPQRKRSQPTTQSRNTAINSDSSEKQPSIQTTTDNTTVTKKIPKKLKPEAFSFLNQIPQRNVSENGIDVSKKGTVVPTVFCQSLDNTIMTDNGSSQASTNEMPSAPPIENMQVNYESITEESLSEFDIPHINSTVGEENVKPPLPTRPPPVFKYPPETFLSPRPISIESISSLDVSQSLSQAPPAYPKLVHSISSPDSTLKCTDLGAQDKILSSKVNKRKSLPSIPVRPAVLKRPLPPLPMSDTENGTESNKEASTIKGTTVSRQANPLPLPDTSTQHTAFKEETVQEQMISSPQERLAQILTNQTSVDNAILLSQKKIASAIFSRVNGSQSNSVSNFQMPEKSGYHDGRKPQEFIETMPERSLANDSDQVVEDESEQQPSYLEAIEAVNPRRFTDHETLINSMNRPALPQKAAPIQRSVSCNSLVQSIKDLSFSVWNSKSEKKRNSDGISLSKKSSRSISVASQSKISVPLSITLIPPNEPIEVISPQHEKKYAPSFDEKRSLQEYPWFHDVDAKEGQLRLLSVGQDGTFLIRPSSKPTEDIQHTICIFYNGKVRNLHLRRIADGRYVLGTKINKSFASLAEMIKYHQEFPVEILPHGSTPLKPQLYRILLRETPPKLQKVFGIV